MLDSGKISTLCSVMFLFFQLLLLFSNNSIIYTYSQEPVTNKISQIFGRTMISCVYLLSNTKVIYLQLRILQRRLIRFIFVILVENVLFIFFISFVFYEKLLRKQNEFSMNNTRIETVKIIS
jgi:presenilin-like A22 family membrane protease